MIWLAFLIYDNKMLLTKHVCSNLLYISISGQRKKSDVKKVLKFYKFKEYNINLSRTFLLSLHIVIIIYYTLIHIFCEFLSNFNSFFPFR